MDRPIGTFSHGISQPDDLYLERPGYSDLQRLGVLPVATNQSTRNKQLKSPDYPYPVGVSSPHNRQELEGIIVNQASELQTWGRWLSSPLRTITPAWRSRRRNPAARVGSGASFTTPLSYSYLIYENNDITNSDHPSNSSHFILSFLRLPTLLLIPHSFFSVSPFLVSAAAKGDDEKSISQKPFFVLLSLCRFFDLFLFSSFDRT